MDDYWYHTETKSAELEEARACEIIEALSWLESVVDRVMGWFKR